MGQGALWPLSPSACRLLPSRLPVSPEKIFLGNLRKQGVGDDVFFAVRESADFFARGVQAWLEQISGTAADRLLFSKNFLFDLFADRSGRLAVETPDVVFRLQGDDRIALAGHDIERCLRTDDLARRSDERRIAQIFSHVRHF